MSQRQSLSFLGKAIQKTNAFLDAIACAQESHDCIAKIGQDKKGRHFVVHRDNPQLSELLNQASDFSVTETDSELAHIVLRAKIPKTPVQTSPFPTQPVWNPKQPLGSLG